METSERPVVVGIGGLTRSGKSTLARDVGVLFDCPVIGLDDFYKVAHSPIN